MSRNLVAVAVLLITLAEAAFAQEPSPSPSPFPTWKDEIAKGYLPHHQLTAEDFPINDEAHPKTAFWLQPFAHQFWHYALKPASNGFVYAYVTDWIVFSGFDKNLSSRNSKFREIKTFLPYMQALFDISELHARKYAALKPGELPSGQGETFEKARAQLDDRLQAMFQTRAWESQKETDEFEKATNKGQNQKKVRELAAEIKKRLAEVPSMNLPQANTAR
jgi:hypothetical protein